MKVWAAFLLSFHIAAAAGAQDGGSARQLFEAGDPTQALQAIAALREQGTSDPADTYLAVQSYVKLDQPDAALGEAARLAASEEAHWQQVGRSSVALIGGDLDQALEAANAAVAAAPDFFFAQYQLGLVKAARQDWNGAADAFGRASQSDATFAYAHYYAGLAYSKIKRPDLMARHFDTFLKLAPQAPERAGVESVMRTLAGR